MRRGDRIILAMSVTRGYIQPGQAESDVRKLMIEASVHASNVRSKASTMLSNVDKSTEPDEVIPTV